MKRFASVVVCALAAGVGFLGFGATPQAFASTYTLNLSVPATATVLQPLVIQASGIHPPPSEFWNVSWIQLVTIPGSLTPVCPGTGQDGVSLATGGGGDLLAIAQRPNLDAAGNYTNTFGWTPRTTGSWLVCAYQDDGEGLTLARAGAIVNVQGATTKPANIKHPRVTRSGASLVCNPGRWSAGATALSYGWLVGGRQLSGASARTLRVTRATRGHRVRCSVTESNAAGATTAVSRAVRVR